MEVEKCLREIAHKEATWGGMLGNGQVPSAALERAGGVDAESGSINGAGGAKGLTRGGAAGGGGGRLMGVGPANGTGTALTETRTLV